MTKPELDPQIKRLERKINLLIGVAVVQSGIITLLIMTLAAQQLMPSMPTMILMLLALAALAYVFRNQIPGWFGSLSRMFFAQMLTTKSDSTKDG